MSLGSISFLDRLLESKWMASGRGGGEGVIGYAAQFPQEFSSFLGEYNIFLIYTSAGYGESCRTFEYISAWSCPREGRKGGLEVVSCRFSSIKRRCGVVLFFLFSSFCTPMKKYGFPSITNKITFGYSKLNVGCKLRSYLYLRMTSSAITTDLLA